MKEPKAESKRKEIQKMKSYSSCNLLQVKGRMVRRIRRFLKELISAYYWAPTFISFGGGLYFLYFSFIFPAIFSYFIFKLMQLHLLGHGRLSFKSFSFVIFIF